MELEITWKRCFRIWWSYVWRNLIAVVVSMIAGGMLGFVLGLILGIAGFSVETIKVVVTPIGFVLGLLISIVPMKMILGKDFGEFRLVLIEKSRKI